MAPYEQFRYQAFGRSLSWALCLTKCGVRVDGCLATRHHLAAIQFRWATGDMVVKLAMLRAREVGRFASALVMLACALSCGDPRTPSVAEMPVVDVDEPTLPGSRSEPSPPPTVDLLPTVATRIATSTTTSSLISSPERMVDGSLASAWASRSGDTAAFVEVELPTDAHVARIELTVGFAHQARGHDLFEENLRIAAVRVTHDGDAREFELDPTNRGLQAIEIDSRGGLYRIDVLRSVPGTIRSYRQVCISELRMFGWAAPGAPPGAGPTFHLGGVAGVSIDDVRVARASLPGIRSTLEVISIENWWTAANTAFNAFPVVCAFPVMRRRITTDVRNVLRAQGHAAAAATIRDELACPGADAPDSEWAGIRRSRNTAREREYNARGELQEALSALSYDYWNWAELCSDQISRARTPPVPVDVAQEALNQLVTRIDWHVEAVR